MNATHHIVRISGLLALCLVGLGSVTTLGGCQKPQLAPATPGADPLARAQYPKVVVETPLARWLVMSEPVVQNAPNGGPLSVTVPIRLMSSMPNQYARIQYRFIFLDSSGSPLRGQSDWRFVRLEPQNQVFLTGNAIDTNAADWRCEIQSGR